MERSGQKWDLRNMPKYAKYGIWGACLGIPNMIKWGVPVKSYDQNSFLPDIPIVITM